LLTIFEHKYRVVAVGPIALNIVRQARANHLLHLHSIDHGRVAWKAAAQLENAHLVSRRVADLDDVLLPVFPVFCWTREGHSLFLLRQRVGCRNCQSQAKNCDGAQCKCTTCFHSRSPISSPDRSPGTHTLPSGRRCKPLRGGIMWRPTSFGSAIWY